MASNNQDLVEEDAADLQFPKEQTLMSNHLINYSNCINCKSDLCDKYIVCVECNSNICLTCFANGEEFNMHKNNHSYQVVNNDYILYKNSNWTAKEELILINGLLLYNNWQIISRQLPNRTIDEIKEHYDYFYIKGNGSDMLPKFKHTDQNVYCQSIVPYRFKLTGVKEPIRQEECSPAGYSAARSDFEYEYDKNAELIVACLDTVESNDQNYNLLTDVQVAVVNSYNRRLLERQRWKHIIREHGLIMPQKVPSWLFRYQHTITPSVCEKLVRFMQFYSGEDFEKLMEGLHRAGELKIKIARLCEFRRLGIRTLEESKLYLKLNNHRDEALKEIKRFQQIPHLNYKFKNVPLNINPQKKKITSPLDVTGLQGYDQLSPKERELCRTVRLTPMNYMELKSSLIAENKKLGFLKLNTARRMLKIDVNKTRKLFDFLNQEGYIKK